ncbi:MULTISPECIES: formimidoylglutamase [unclassified Flavobacterium]|uniref:formimidoylglutamase n=1 Tax=unclassified Flavobacterium TaxID=196869 RepID=UPI00129154AA|nr:MULTISPECIES: formimidoylglutamase [unclassified Flavobacterium]MQP51901.1 arginase [Flavobacterium sp. LMO9]MQP61770.1 arginase [Flavobacterium sp. LMO6]
MVFDFLQPISSELEEFIQSLSNQALGKKVVFHTQTDFPVLENVSLAIITVNEYRGANKSNSEFSFEIFRKKFYSMFPGNWNTTIVDLGTIEAGASIDDTYFVVKNLMSELIKKKIIPIIVGGSQDITYAMYRAYDNLDQMVNLVSVDNQFDFAKETNLVSSSFLSKIIVEEPNNLFNYSNLGFQTYFNSQEEIDLIEKLYFEAYRLGEVSNNITVAEPVFRDADLVSIDMNSVQSSYSGNFDEFNPNGFTGKEICALARYAGISDKVTSFGVFNFNTTSNEVVLTAQMLWYFIEGFCFRSNEYPFGTKEHYIKYIVPIDDEELVFYKSNKTERWWIEIPFLTNVNNKLKRNTLLPCMHEDYLAACEQEIPERWWKAQRRNIA